ncbi:MAG: polyprenol monophosphomannose synthase [Lentisphaeria bacterium]|nr:polyprenol monophosphomannose synthase [Lentisphaeria bacterium]
MNCRCTIVIPTLNERDNMVPLLSRIETAGIPGCHILVVDENSPDGTLEAVRAYAAGKPHIRGITNDGIPGLGPSIVKGFSLADSDILCCMDGDLQHDVSNLKGLIEAAETHDLVIGSRYVSGGGFAERWNPVRVIISRTAAWLARLVLGVRVNDPMSGFFAVRREAFMAIRPQLDPRGFKIMLEILYLLTQKGNYRITEYGITFGKRLHGQSKLSARVMLQYLKMLVALRRR